MKTQIRVSLHMALLSLFACVCSAQTIDVTKARIGCLDIQKDGNLTAIVARACNGKMTCSYKAPTQEEYQREGVKAATRTFCTQGMEITFKCGAGPDQVVSVPGDAWNHPPADLVCQATLPPAPVLSPSGGPLKGFVDLHTHPLANLGFGGKLLYGGVDVGSLLPADPDCHHNVVATSMEQALGHDNSTHGGVDLLHNQCGDYFRSMVAVPQLVGGTQGAAAEVGDSSGAPNFPNWPVWNDIIHQKMWVDWIRRAYVGGLRVMVALAVNNKTLADTFSGPGDGPDDDKASADLQISHIKAFVGRHSDFMEIALTSEDVQRIVSANKLAVVLGVEIDNIGNLGNKAPASPAAISAEVDRIYGEGVRYVFPVHLLDNPFGGTAVYDSIFNDSNYREEGGHYWDLECAPRPANASEAINYQFDNPMNAGLFIGAATKIGTIFPATPTYPKCGQANKKGLTPDGQLAIKDMMRHGMLIDIDHMSDLSKNETIAIAEAQHAGSIVGYPLNSGHAGLRGFFPPGVARTSGDVSERSMSAAQYSAISKLHGMAGVGSADVNAYEWADMYQQVMAAMGNPSMAGSGAVGAFGTDTDGLAMGMKPRPGSRVTYSSSFPLSGSGSKTWNYNQYGVAHYGMLWDFLMDVKTSTSPDGNALVEGNLMNGAEYFFQTWNKCEQLKTAIQ